MEGRQLTLFDFEEHDHQERAERRTRAEIFQGYEAFVEKFKPKKTTDDCYTPQAVYDAVLAFVGRLVDLTGRPVCRPFWPGYNYQEYPYPEGCVVVDNPPFSIYTQIVRWYLSRGIDFFLFSPSLTTFVRGADVTYFITNASITYENGAVVNTSFVSNLVPGVRIWLNPDLRAAIDACAPPPKMVPKNTYPDTVVTSAILGKIIDRHVELKILSDDAQWVKNLDTLERAGKSLWGGLHPFRTSSSRTSSSRTSSSRTGSRRTGSSRTGSSRTGSSRTGSRHPHHPVAGRTGHRGATDERRLQMKFAFVNTNTFNDLCFRVHISNIGGWSFFNRQPSPLASRLERLLTASAICVRSAGGLFYYLLCVHRTKPASHCQRISRTISPRLSCPPSPTSKSPGRCSTSSPSSCSTSPVPCRAGSATGSRSCWVKSRTSTTSAARCSSTSSPRLSRAFLSVNPCCYDHR